MRFFYAVCFIFSSISLSRGQNIAINTNGGNADVSAILQVAAANKGLLIPQVVLTGSTDATTITTPANSLLVYNTSASVLNGLKGAGFYYNNGTPAAPVWVRLANTANNFADTSSAWLITGNSNTDTLVNFVGTKDNMPLRFKLNNKWTGQWNIGLGNYFTGDSSGIRNTSGAKNIGLGIYTLFDNTSGRHNIGLGRQVLANNTTGSYNVGIGDSVLYNNSTASNNVAIGRYNMMDNTTGGNNVSLGNRTFNDNTIGTYNVAIGQNALGASVKFTNNIAIGVDALIMDNVNVSHGDYATKNVAIGTSAGASIVPNDGVFVLRTGANNVSVGANTMNLEFFNYQCTVIGASGGTSNGSENVSALGYNTNPFGIGIANAVRLGDGSTAITGAVNFTVSDGRFKTNVQEKVPGLDFTLKLRPLTYFLHDTPIDKDASNPDSTPNNTKTSSGFIAQEVESAAQHIRYDFDGLHLPQNENDRYMLAYAQFIVPLVKSVQEQQETILQLKDNIAQRKLLLESLKAKLLKLEQQKSK